MRQIYTSPRQENIDLVIALMAEHGIETSVGNRSNYNRPTWQRFSYSEPQAERDRWPQVWISHADDYTKARLLLREIGIEPVIRYAEELAVERNPTPASQRQHTVARVRRVTLLLVLVAFAMVAWRYVHGF